VILHRRKRTHESGKIGGLRCQSRKQEECGKKNRDAVDGGLINKTKRDNVQARAILAEKIGWGGEKSRYHHREAQGSHFNGRKFLGTAKKGKSALCLGDREGRLRGRKGIGSTALRTLAQGQKT